MTSILSKSKNYLALGFTLLFVSLLPGFCNAQESLSLSVTPPLFQLSAVPGQSWQSSVKIINSNSFDLTVYADPVNFTPIGEEGRSRFMPIFREETEGKTLAEWINVTREPIVIPAETSYQLPFSVTVPSEPAPGGHYAALLVGTRSPEGDGTVVSTSQIVSSLLFLRVAGEVLESGHIREFSVDNSFTETPEASFVLRFENRGNVHLRPEGHIRIFNMWGKERGLIPINQVSSFGNVLPSSTRKFSLDWRGEQSITDMGRYTAEVTLAYGNELRQNVSQKVHFWVIPVRAAGIALISLIMLIVLVRWAIKSYVRHMLYRAGIDPDEHTKSKRAGDVAMLRRMPSQPSVPVESAEDDEQSTFLRRQLPFLIGIPSVMVLIGSLLWFMAGALTTERAYEVTVDAGGEVTEINSEEMRLQALQESSPSDTLKEQALVDEQGYVLDIVNASGDPGAAAALAVTLEEAGFIVSSVEPELNSERQKSVVVANPETVMQAKTLSSYAGNALVSVVDPPAEETTSTITIFIGKDLAQN